MEYHPLFYSYCLYAKCIENKIHTSSAITERNRLALLDAGSFFFAYCLCTIVLFKRIPYCASGSQNNYSHCFMDTARFCSFQKTGQDIFSFKNKVLPAAVLYRVQFNFSACYPVVFNNGLVL